MGLRALVIFFTWCFLSIEVLTQENVTIECDSTGNLTRVQSKQLDVSFANTKGSDITEKVCEQFADCLKQFESISDISEPLRQVLEVQKRNFAYIQNRSVVGDSQEIDLNYRMLQLNSYLNACRRLSHSMKKDDNSTPLQIDYPHRGINTLIRGRYDVAKLEKIIKAAIINQTDPALALAISLLENPPVLRDPTSTDKSEIYDRVYGGLPIDLTAMSDVLGCVDTKKSKKAVERVDKEKLRRITDLNIGIVTAREQLEKLARNKAVRNYIMSQSFTGDPGAQTSNSKLFYQLRAIESELRRRRGGEESKEDQSSSSTQVASDYSQSKEYVDYLDRLSFMNESNLEKEGKEIRFRMSLLGASSTSSAGTKNPVDMSVPEVASYKEAENKLSQLQNERNNFLDSMSLLERNALECKLLKGRCRAVMTAQEEVPFVDLSPLNYELGTPVVERTLCLPQTAILTAAAPSFSSQANSNDGCCINVRTHQDPNLESKVKGYLAQQYLRLRLQSCAKNNSIESCIQRYHGLGCFGCTEKLGNSCQNGLVGEDRPFYGSRAADIIINSLNSNPEILDMIQKVKQELQLPVKSIFCINRGKGQHNLKSQEYLDKQKQYLLHGDENYYLASWADGKKARPASTDDEKSKYNQIEAERRINCQKYFAK